jgi:hypothetical protein
LRKAREAGERRERRHGKSFASRPPRSSGAASPEQTSLEGAEAVGKPVHSGS